MHHFITATLLVGGIIHLLPIVGALGSERLATLYGVAITDPNVLILLRHRAVLFGVVGGLMILAVFRPSLQPLAFVVGLISVISFLYIAWSVGQYNALVSRVVSADIVALACLLAGAMAHALQRLKVS